MKHKRLIKVLVGLVLTIVIASVGYHTVSAAIANQKSKETVERLSPPEETHESYTERGQAYANLGELDLAINDYNTALDLHPSECPNIFYFRARANAQKGDYEQAIADYTKSIQLNSSWYGGYQGRAYLYAHLGKYETAFDDINQAIALEPDYFQLYHDRAWINRLRGNIEGAAADYIISKIKWAESQAPSPAPDHKEAITFKPLVDEGSRLSSQVPENWQHIGENFYTSDNITQLGIQRADVNAEQWRDWLMSQFQQKGFDTEPVFAQTLTLNNLTWNLYTTTFDGNPVDVAFAERHQETLMVLLLSQPDEHETLYERVYMPILNKTMFLEN